MVSNSAKDLPNANNGGKDVAQRDEILNDLRQWITPPPGVVKVNYEASFDAILNIAGIVAVIRDSSGNIIGGANR
ncbi:hypothetical protein V6N11_028981 [Hibiscus sabdariffa]|uniref:Uncharacterized protein n=1 Tax=Hibiscus sabdariffa TaxID=183260 RepID=A0ABR2NWA2_9ROSI